jgi:hypothetical protein
MSIMVVENTMLNNVAFSKKCHIPKFIDSERFKEILHSIDTFLFDCDVSFYFLVSNLI